MMNPRRPLALLITLVVLAAVLTPAWGQQQIRTRAGAHDGFGRIVFDWPDGKLEEASVDDGRLRLRFAEPFTSDYAGVLRHLYRYVSKVEASEDQRTLQLTLLQPVTPRVRRIGKVLAVDLLPAAGPQATTAAEPANAKPEAPGDAAADGAAKPAAAVPAKTAAPLEEIKVRSGEHGTYSRFVVEWTKDVGYRVRRNGQAVTITFDRPARLDIATLVDSTPRHLRNVTSDVVDGSTVLRLTTVPHARYRHFRSGTGVVLDLLDPPPSVRRRQAQQRKEEQDAATKADAAQDAPAPAPAPAAAPAPPPVALLPPSEGADTGPKTTAATPRAGDAAAPVAGKAGPVEPDPLRYRTPKRRVSLGGGPALSAEAAVYDEGLVLRFAWPEPVPATVFLRAGYLWVTFERAATLQLDQLHASSGILEAFQVANRNATILRLRLRDGLYPQVSRDEGQWSVRLLPGSGQPRQSLVAAIQHGDDGDGRVFVPVIDTGGRQIVYDPEVGDEIVLVPLLGSGAGVLEQRDFVDFRLLPSAQGVVIRPNSDGVEVRPLRNGVEIAASSGLALSSPESRARAGGDPAGVKYKASLKPPLLVFKD